MQLLNINQNVLSMDGGMHEMYHATELLLSALRNEIIEAGETEEIADAILDKIVSNAKIAKDFSSVRVGATSEELDQEIVMMSLLKNIASELNGEEVTLERDYESLSENTKVFNRYVRLNPNVMLD
jgi:hypothetical protein